MPKRRPKRVAKTTDVAARLRKALAKRTKDELIDVLVEWAKEDRSLLRRLPPGEIAAWCKAMTKADRVACIYDRELEALRKHAEASAT